MAPQARHTTKSSAVVKPSSRLQVDSRDEGAQMSGGKTNGPPRARGSSSKTRTGSYKSKSTAHNRDDRGVRIFGSSAVDEVEEYVFSSEEKDVDEEDDFGDVRSHISLSSDDSPKTDNGGSVDDRPWLSMSRSDRKEYEIMLANITCLALAASWDYTEEYQLQMDKLMLKYMEDFPIPTWVIGQAEAERAYGSLMHRTKWRSLGIRIFSSEALPSLLGNRQHAPPTPYQAQPAHAPYYQSNGPGGPPQAPPYRHPPPVSLPPPSPQQLRPQLMTASSGGLSNPPVPQGAPYFPPQILHQFPTGVQPHQTHSAMQPAYYPPQMQPGPAYQSMTVMQQLPEASKSKQMRGKEKKEISPMTSPAPPLTPPYPERKRPTERRSVNKSGRRNVRRQAEAETFPWARDLDFKKAKAEATWDDNCYDPVTFKNMAEIRKRNEPIIDRLDQEVAEKQRVARNFKKNAVTNAEDGSSDALGGVKRGRKKRDPNDKSDNSDPYHSGNYAFATPEAEKLALQYSSTTPDAAIDAGEADELPLEVCADIKICWNPGKKGSTQDLLQAAFSVKDAVLTRKQVARTPILTRRAAECIIDFCPDMLWRDMLLRICSEAGCGNKDVRDRFCLNGCHADKATITKRISAALGQKQTQPKAKGYGPGEYDFYEGNGEDFKNYIEFFGKRTTHRHMKVGGKRRLSSMAAEASGGEDESGVRLKRAKTEDTITSGVLSSEAEGDADMDEDVDDEDDVLDGGAGDDEAVSAQDSDALDAMSD